MSLNNFLCSLCSHTCANVSATSNLSIFDFRRASHQLLCRWRRPKAKLWTCQSMIFVMFSFLNTFTIIKTKRVKYSLVSVQECTCARYGRTLAVQRGDRNVWLGQKVSEYARWRCYLISRQQVAWHEFLIQGFVTLFCRCLKQGMQDIDSRPCQEWVLKHAGQVALTVVSTASFRLVNSGGQLYHPIAFWYYRLY